MKDGEESDEEGFEFQEDAYEGHAEEDADEAHEEGVLGGGGG